MNGVISWPDSSEGCCISWPLWSTLPFLPICLIAYHYVPSFTEPRIVSWYTSHFPLSDFTMSSLCLRTTAADTPCRAEYIIILLNVSCTLLCLCTALNTMIFYHPTLCDQSVWPRDALWTWPRCHLFMFTVYVRRVLADSLAIKTTRLYCVLGSLFAFHSHNRPLCLTLRQQAHDQSCCLPCRLLQHTHWGRAISSSFPYRLDLFWRLILVIQCLLVKVPQPQTESVVLLVPSLSAVLTRIVCICPASPESCIRTTQI